MMYVTIYRLSDETDNMLT